MIFSVFSIGYLYKHRKTLYFTSKDWKEAFSLGFFGNFVFYWVLSEAVIRIGAAMTGVFTACIPVTVSLWVLFKEKSIREVNTGLWFALLMIATGLLILNFERIEVILWDSNCLDNIEAKSLLDYLYGICLALGSVVIWTWFPIKNATWLRKHPAVTTSVWTATQGASLFPIMLIATMLQTSKTNTFVFPDGNYFFWVLVLGLGCSWLGNVLWNMASRQVPSMIMGQLLVFETIFAILYSCILTQSWPSSLSIFASLVVIVGVMISVHILR